MKRRNFIQNTLIGFSLLPLAEFEKRLLDSSVDQSLATSLPRKKLRELGFKIGTLETGRLNAITDVEGVRVGQTTIIKGKGKAATRTGVTVILPHSGNIYE